jgi:hypothetical protein
MTATPQGRFAPVPLPSLAPGELTAARLDPVLREWAGSAPMRALAEAAGWAWPSSADTGELIRQLAELSADWDFRSRGGGVVERDFIDGQAALEGEREIPEDLVISAAGALGLVSATPIPPERFTSLVVLAGLVRACVNRTRHASVLLREGVKAGSVAVLGGHRELSPDEKVLAKEQGFGELFDEAQVVLAATEQSFGLDGAPESEVSGPRRGDWDNELRTASARYRWPTVEVLIVPSGQPDRRVNTEDQLRYWAARNAIGRDDRVLLLTTQIYVPFQQLVALRVLGIERGCAVHYCGVDAGSSYLPARSFSGRSYLQEIRSALLAADALMTAAREASG